MCNKRKQMDHYDEDEPDELLIQQEGGGIARKKKRRRSSWKDQLNKQTRVCLAKGCQLLARNFTVACGALLGVYCALVCMQGLHPIEVNLNVHPILN